MVSHDAPLDDLFVLSDREFATVLCALRTIQDATCDARSTCEDHFQEHTPLTNAEIDDLCERLNKKGN